MMVAVRIQCTRDPEYNINIQVYDNHKNSALFIIIHTHLKHTIGIC